MINASMDVQYINPDGTLTFEGKKLLDRIGDADAEALTSVAWGDVTGTLSAQADLDAALDGKADAAHTHVIADVTGLQAALDATIGETFETVSSNLDADDATYTYSGGLLTEITYASGVIKTLNYTGSDLTSVVLSGSTPSGIELTKTFTYSGGDLTAISYS